MVLKDELWPMEQRVVISTDWYKLSVGIRTWLYLLLANLQ